MKYPELHYLMFGNTNPWRKGRGLRDQFMKNVHDEDSMEYKIHVFYSPQGVWAQFTKNILLKISGNGQKSLEILMFDNNHHMG